MLKCFKKVDFFYHLIVVYVCIQKIKRKTTIFHCFLLEYRYSRKQFFDL